MAWNTGTTYISSDPVNAALLNGIGNDLRTRGGDQDGGNYGLPNNKYIVLNPAALPASATAGEMWIDAAKRLNVFDGTNWRRVGGSAIAPATYDFAAQSPAASLTVGSNVIAFSPLPAGITSALSPGIHFLYITDGVHGNEAVPITAVSGANVTVTCALVHTSGQWTIGSASNGLQEALIVAGSSGPAGGRIDLDPDNPVIVHWQVTIPSTGGQFALDGLSMWRQTIQRASDYPNGNLLYQPAGFFSMLNVGFNNQTSASQTSGAAFESKSYTTMGNCYFSGGYRSVVLTGCVGLLASNNFINSTSHTDTNVLMQAGAAVCNDIVWIGGQVFGGTTSASAAFRLTGVDGAVISSVAGGGAGIYLYISPTNSSPSYVANINVNGVFCDVSTQRCVRIDPAGGSTSLTKVVIQNSTFLGGTGTGGSAVALYGLDIASSTTGGNVGYIKVQNCFIQYCTSDGISVGNTTGEIEITGCTSVGHGGNGLNNVGCQHLAVMNCILNDNALCGLKTDFTANLVWTGGEALGNTNGPANIASVPVEFVHSGVRGIDNVVPSAVASATSINAPLNPIFPVSGTTTITTIAKGWQGRRIRVIKTDAGTVTIGGGGNIPGTHSLAQYGGLDLVQHSDSNWY